MTDTPTEHSGTADLLSLTADIVVAFLANNKVEPVAVPEVIGATHAALVQLTAPQVEAISEPAREKPNRAAIRKSVTEEGIVSFLDGQTYRTLKRHLTTRGYTPASYREAFGLPDDYPIVAPGYSAVRSAQAKAIGLGAKRNGAPPKKRAKRAS
nr:MucR family transcriptional regulator [uncultured Brevundimonas sp.]